MVQQTIDNDARIVRCQRTIRSLHAQSLQCVSHSERIEFERMIDEESHRLAVLKRVSSLNSVVKTRS